MNLQETLRNAGVVGAGGAGFPTHVKLGAQNVEYYLVNGAECEPLMHKDRELMIHFAQEIVKGLKIVGDAVGAKKLVFGIKSKNADAIKAVKKAIDDERISICEFGDFYPAGDEYELVYGITGRLIPPQGLPLDVGCVVNNVETLYNVYLASQNQTVTETFLTITGLVKKPITVKAPIGMSVKDALNLASGTTVKEFGLMESGLMMGKLITDINQPITKTTGGIIVLPKDHNLITRYSTPIKQQHRIGHSACDQCSYCTELCPRYLLGYDVQPHKVMRSLGFSQMGSKLWNTYSQLCCQCGLCTLFSCPEALYPREACVQGMNDLRELGKGKWEGPREVKAHPMKDSRRIPIKQLMRRLGVLEYDADAHYKDKDINPDKVTILLKQHVGAPAEPIVKENELVKKGQEIANVPADKLGVAIHASINGTITKICDNAITITRN